MNNIRIIGIILLGVLVGCGGADEAGDELLPSGPGIEDNAGFPTDPGTEFIRNRPQTGNDAYAEKSEDTSTGDVEDSNPAAPEDSVETSPDTSADTTQIPVVDTVQEEIDTHTIPPANEVAGGILIFEVDSSFASATSAAVGAAFGPPAVPEALPSGEYGPCVVSSNDQAVTLPEVDTLDAGQILLMGLAQPVSLAFTETADGPRYLSSLAEDATDIFAGLESTIIASSTGGQDVTEGFSVEIETPPPVEITSPSLGPTKNIDTSSPLNVTWNGGTGGTFVNIFLAGVGFTGDLLDGPTVSCTVEGDPGSLVIPANALELLPKGLLSNVLLAVSRGHESLPSDTSVPVTITTVRTFGGIAQNH